MTEKKKNEIEISDEEFEHILQQIDNGSEQIKLEKNNLEKLLMERSLDEDKQKQITETEGKIEELRKDYLGCMIQKCEIDKAALAMLKRTIDFMKDWKIGTPILGEGAKWLVKENTLKGFFWLATMVAGKRIGATVDKIIGNTLGLVGGIIVGGIEGAKAKNKEFSGGNRFTGSVKGVWQGMQSTSKQAWGNFKSDLAGGKSEDLLELIKKERNRLEWIKNEIEKRMEAKNNDRDFNNLGPVNIDFDNSNNLDYINPDYGSLYSTSPDSLRSANPDSDSLHSINSNSSSSDFDNLPKPSKRSRRRQRKKVKAKLEAEAKLNSVGNAIIELNDTIRGANKERVILGATSYGIDNSSWD